MCPSGGNPDHLKAQCNSLIYFKEVVFFFHSSVIFYQVVTLTHIQLTDHKEYMILSG